MIHRISGVSLVVFGVLSCFTEAATAADRARPGSLRPKTPAAPAPSVPGPSELRPKVEALLSGYEWVPTAEDWRKLGPNAGSVLEEIARDPSLLPSRRSRAAAALASIEQPQAAERLIALAEDQSLPPQLRSTAAIALGARLGRGAVAKLTALIASPEPLIREGAAKALGKIGTPSARLALTQRLAAETNPVVQAALESSLNSTAR